MLAPIEDVTGNALRTICHKYGADLTYTVMTRVEGLARMNKSTWSRLEFKDETPTEIQLLGVKEEHFKKFLANFKPHKGFMGFNLNIGCPSPQVIKIGIGAAMIKRIAKVQKIAKIFRAEGYNFSIKTRLGLNKYEREKKAYLNIINNVDADYFIVHARDGSQSYNEPADFSVYQECVDTGRKIVANGDISNKEHIDMLKSVKVYGAMIGRAAVIDPGIFGRLKGEKILSKDDILKEYIALSEKYEEPYKYRKNVIKHAEGLVE